MHEAKISAPIQVVDYDPEWPRIFSQLRDRIWPAVRDVAVALEHVGSTSVPGLTAKPVIDLDLVIASPDDLPALIERLEALGYKHRGDLGIEGRDAFARPSNSAHHHLYACLANSVAFRNHIAVRDYLRAHPSEVAVYSSLKKELAERFRSDRERYIGGKTSFVVSVLEKCGFSPSELAAIERAQPG